LDKKKLALHNLKIHYIGTFMFSVAFLAPIITLFYSYHNFWVNEILLLSSIYLLATFILEIPTSSIGDNYSRSKVLKISIFINIVPLIIYAFFPYKELIYSSLFFAALSQALWSGTAQAKLQEDLIYCDKEKDFWEVIWKLISLMQIWTLLTPIVIFVLLKSYWDIAYFYLAILDLIIWFVIMYFISQFKDYSENKKIEKNNIKQIIRLNLLTIKDALKAFLVNKKLLLLLIIMIFSSNLYFLSKIILPHIVNNWIEDYLSSSVVWFSTLAWVIASYNTWKLANKIWWNKLFQITIFLNFLLHLLSAIFYENNIIISVIFIFIIFIQMSYIPTRNHLLNFLITTKQKATIRSIFVSAILLYTSIMLFILSFLEIQASLFIITFLIFIWFLLSMWGWTKWIGADLFIKQSNKNKQ